MPDYLMYWKYFWQDIEEDADSFNYFWHTRNMYFFDQVEPGNSLWVIISGGSQYPNEWRLLQRIVVQKKFVKYEYDLPYGIEGHPKKSRAFELEGQADLTSLLHKLDFVSGKRIVAKGRGIGNTIQMIRPLTKSDTALLTQYAKTLKPYALDERLDLDNDFLNVDSLDKGLKVGAGFGNPETNKKVEIAAVLFVTEWYESRGWKVKSVEAEKCGYDLQCVKGSSKRHVEVKGVQGGLPAFIITAAEVKQAQSNSSFIICVVTSALSNNPTLYRYTGKEFIEQFVLTPSQYRAVLRK